MTLGEMAFTDPFDLPGSTCNVNYNICLCGNALNAINPEGYVALAAFAGCCVIKAIYDQWAGYAVRRELKRNDDMIGKVVVNELA